MLTVDYSCAIKLAAPVAVKSGMYAAGIGACCSRAGRALDNLARVDTAVFDKTGDSDQGRSPGHGPRSFEWHGRRRAARPGGRGRGGITPIQWPGPWWPRPGSAALPLPPISQVDFIVAHGVSAFVEGQRVLVGSRHFIEDDEGVDCSFASDMGSRLRGQGKSLLYVAHKGRLAGVIALRDELRPEAVEAIRLLKERGVGRIVMLTGDHRDTARAIAESLGGIGRGSLGTQA